MGPWAYAHALRLCLLAGAQIRAPVPVLACTRAHAWTAGVNRPACPKIDTSAPAGTLFGLSGVIAQIFKEPPESRRTVIFGYAVPHPFPGLQVDLVSRPEPIP